MVGSLGGSVSLVGPHQFPYGQPILSVCPLVKNPNPSNNPILVHPPPPTRVTVPVKKMPTGFVPSTGCDVPSAVRIRMRVNEDEHERLPLLSGKLLNTLGFIPLSSQG